MYVLRTSVCNTLTGGHMALPSQDYLNECLIYYPHSGALVWRERPQNHFSSVRGWKQWNRIHAHQEAFTARSGGGYACGGIDYKSYLAHPIIWKMVTGDEPEAIDHDNGIRDDNRWVNLNASSYALNAKNTAKSSRNTSGIAGVSWSTKRNKWRVQIGIGKGKNKHIGYFDTLDEAKDAKARANIEYGYHPNHGTTRA